MAIDYVITTLVFLECLRLLRALLLVPEILAAIIGVVGVLVAAIIGVHFAFRQIREQFRQKVTYEGWKEIQDKIFDFSHKLSTYTANVQTLRWNLEQRNNRFVNKGNAQQFVREKWDDFTSHYFAMNEAYLAFLQALETHEVIFLPLQKMKTAFDHRFDDVLGVKAHHDFERKIFPFAYGEQDTPQEEINQLIKDHCEVAWDIMAWLNDFRVQLQNLSIGKILQQELPQRSPEQDHEVLTLEGFVNIKGKKK